MTERISTSATAVSPACDAGTTDLKLGAVIIGRNEGQRLINCLNSFRDIEVSVVYVDSGSTDESVAAARAWGAQVVELDMQNPFTAARARNAGFAALINAGPIDFIQFIDGDCELQPGWINAALEFLSDNPDAGVACGRRRERHPERSVYNRLCDEEWNTPVGQTRACGGDALMRVAAFREVGGFNPGMIAGEEPELCVRLRAAGWNIWRLDREMTLHDADMTRLGQWWKRTRRSGHAFAEGAALHGAPPERHNVPEQRRILLWGLGLPTVILLAAVWIVPWAVTGLLLYPAQVVRLAARRGVSNKFSWEQAFFLTSGKFPEMIGVMEYHLRKMTRRPAGLIEYK